MGQPKAWLPWGNDTLLGHVVQTLLQIVEPVVVVSAPGQALPPLPSGALVTSDQLTGQGPLAGLSAGLALLVEKTPVAFVASCDCPLLSVEFAAAMLERLENYDVAVPSVQGQLHPLAAVYRTQLRTQIEIMLAAGERRLIALCSRCRTRQVAEEELRSFDAGLSALFNVNDPTAYAQALRLAGLNLPGV